MEVIYGFHLVSELVDVFLVRDHDQACGVSPVPEYFTEMTAKVVSSKKMHKSI
jgi:hypothetical protein